MKKALLIWTVVVIVACFFTVINVPKQRFYEGEQVEFVTSRAHLMSVTGKDARIEAVSTGFFVFRSESNTTLTGIPEEAPVGWNKNYYKLSPTEITQGIWNVEAGDKVTVRITSKTDNASVVITYKAADASEIKVLTCCAYLIAWILGLFVIVVSVEG